MPMLTGLLGPRAKEVRLLADSTRQSADVLRGRAPVGRFGQFGSHRQVLWGALAAAVAVAALSVAPGATAATPGSVTELSRTIYSNQTSVADAAKYQFVVLGGSPGAQSQASVGRMIASIHQNDPGTKVLVYKDSVASPRDPGGIQGCAPWNSSQPDGGIPLSWFLKNSSGAPYYNTHYDVYELDPGNPQVQQACASSAVALAKASGFDGVMWDSISTSEFWAELSPSTCSSATCSSNASFDAAEASYVTAISAALHANGLLSIGNIAGGAVTTCCGGGPAYWQSLQLDGFDGASEESFTAGTNHLPVATNVWKQEVANVAWNEAHGKYFLGNGDVGTNEAADTYGLASVLLAAEGHSSWDVSAGNYYSGEYWPPEYTTALGLGAPTGAYYAQPNGLYVRKFQNGTVVVNPNASSISDSVYGVLGAYSGRILGSTGAHKTRSGSSAASGAGGSGGRGRSVHGARGRRGHHRHHRKRHRRHRHHRRHKRRVVAIRANARAPD